MPDFENFKKAVLCQGEPKRVPQFDGTVAEVVKSRLLGRPMTALADEVEFCMEAGYDFVPLTLGFRQTIRGEKLGIMGASQLESAVLRPLEAQYNPFQEGKNTRMWAEEGTGAILDDASFDNFDWPDPDTAYRYDIVEQIGRLLPDGAMAVINVGYIFMAPWMLMGLENFCMALAAGDPGNALSDEDIAALKEYAHKWGTDFCRQCGYCEPCDENVPIRKIMLLAEKLADPTADKTKLRQGYADLETNGEACVECEKCEEKCPYDLPIMERIGQVHKALA